MAICFFSLSCEKGPTRASQGADLLQILFLTQNLRGVCARLTRVAPDEYHAFFGAIPFSSCNKVGEFGSEVYQQALQTVPDRARQGLDLIAAQEQTANCPNTAARLQQYIDDPELAVTDGFFIDESTFYSQEKRYLSAEEIYRTALQGRFASYGLTQSEIDNMLPGAYSVYQKFELVAYLSYLGGLQGDYCFQVPGSESTLEQWDPNYVAFSQTGFGAGDRNFYFETCTYGLAIGGGTCTETLPEF